VSFVGVPCLEATLVVVRFELVVSRKSNELKNLIDLADVVLYLSEGVGAKCWILRLGRCGDSTNLGILGSSSWRRTCNQVGFCTTGGFDGLGRKEFDYAQCRQLTFDKYCLRSIFFFWKKLVLGLREES
jgi:hypothetical protein